MKKLTWVYNFDKDLYLLTLENKEGITRQLIFANTNEFFGVFYREADTRQAFGTQIQSLSFDKEKNRIKAVREWFFKNEVLMDGEDIKDLLEHEDKLLLDELPENVRGLVRKLFDEYKKNQPK